jgi:2-polyprenyl-3-methyl-5-hydroxy-6-metoxy-1,4-benzoquinol methylase
MSLYDSIASSYDLVFPVRPPKVAFASSLAQPSGTSILDIGCSTGTLALELARKGFQVTGVDLDADMIRLAAERARAGSLDAAFEELDMRRVGERFAGRAFGTILCLGNTVVHLEDASAIGSFLGEAGRILAPKGRFAVQLVNYERVMAGEIASLPTIDNEHVRFTRSYRVDHEWRRVLFSTELTLKATRVVHRDETALYPLTQTELLGMLAPHGLALEACHADFTGRPFSPRDDSLIAVLRRAGE